MSRSGPPYGDGRRARVVVLASGSGTLAEALLVAAADVGYPATVVAVGSDRDAEALGRAEHRGAATFTVRPADHASRADWDRALADAVGEHRPDLVVSAGFLRIIGAPLLTRNPLRILNTHPALLPAFPGMHAVRDALAYGARVTGATVHLVDAGVDTGPIVAQRSVEVAPTDDEAGLHERIKVVERELLVDVVRRMVRDGWTVRGRRVTIP